MEERQGLRAYGFARGDSVKNVKKDATKVVFRGISLERHLAGTEHFENDGDHVWDDSGRFRVANGVNHLPKFAGDSIFCFQIYIAQV